MKKILSILLLAIALVTFSFGTFGRSALASDESSNGATIFSANCASCHIGGINVIIAEKNLKMEALQKYLQNFNSDSLEAIIAQVQHGKNAMPAFKDKLTAQQISDVATYVLQKAQQGW
ncbi:MAG: c-type cytochrome [Nostocaceae cyanobacterium]|nr:c-type cytochrome [Nostocaceae cyanobacterium]